MLRRGGIRALVVFEDAHWGDATTIELLGVAARDIDRYPILALITARPEFHPPWKRMPM